MDVKVIGAGCKECDELYNNVLQALKELGINANVFKVEGIVEIVSLGIMSAPTLMVDGNILIEGRSAKKKELIKLFKNL